MLGWLGGIGLAAMAAAGYNAMAARSQLYGRTFAAADKGSKRVALTFDDGPNDPWTPRLLEVLARHNVPATFFLIGRFVVERPEIAEQIAAAGHVIGNHTFTHPNLIFTSAPEVERQIKRCQRVLLDTVGKHSKLFRPPYGGRTPEVLRTARRCGLEPIMWSVSGNDWKAKSHAQIEDKILDGLQGGDVILLHDGGHRHLGVDRSHTVAALERIIMECRQRGLQFVTVPTMMESKSPAYPGETGQQQQI
ncbi:MAG TPA: polysaccharide deacetylase family protein [Terriglobales bacterium]|nr:polysaccharide deacetylase family protein [Terriglobales bacterium]